MDRDDTLTAEGSVTKVFRLWLELSKEDEIIGLLELIKQELARRRRSLSYEVRPLAGAGIPEGPA